MFDLNECICRLALRICIINTYTTNRQSQQLGERIKGQNNNNNNNNKNNKKREREKDRLDFIVEERKIGANERKGKKKKEMKMEIDQSTVFDEFKYVRWCTRIDIQR